jgi:hypothetical protein
MAELTVLNQNEFDSPDAKDERVQGRSQKWRRRLDLELALRRQFDALSISEWIALLEATEITTKNFDTVLSLDFPHYCSGATELCGGARGWCYTFQGKLAGSAHHKKVALIDAASERVPELLAQKVVQEVEAAVARHVIPYANLRYSGSGEVGAHHVTTLVLIKDAGVRLWGFSRNFAVAEMLRARGVSVIISSDRSTAGSFLRKAVELGFPIAYTSTGVDDPPPVEAFVVFPLHKRGRVQEVVDVNSLCPKVVEEYFYGHREQGACQLRCQRCHRQ